MSRLELQVLSCAEIEKIHTQSLDILEQVGVKVLDAECRDALARAGASVDDASDTVLLPRQIVREALSLAPSTLELHLQDGNVFSVGGSQRAYGSLVIDPWIIDYDTQEPRRPVLDDLVRHTRLGDALPMVKIIHRMDMPPADVPPQLAYIKTLEAFVTNTTKHVTALPSTMESTDDWLEIAEILAEDRELSRHPIMTFGVAVTSPLTFTHVNGYILRRGVEKNLPIVPVICPMAGSTSPLTFAGNVLLANAENLFLITLTQLLRAGAKSVYASGQSVMDLRTGHDIYYNADKMLWKIANAQMGNYYELPVSGEQGGTLVGRYDIQNGIENALLMLPSVACGQHIVGGLGSNYNACGMSAEMIVMQAELAELMERLSAGIDTSDQMLGYDSIAAAGPGGHFLEDMLTIKMLRSGEFYTGGSFDRLGERSPNDPKDSMLVRAHEKVERLIATHQPAVKEPVAAEIHRWARKKEAAAGR